MKWILRLLPLLAAGLLTGCGWLSSLKEPLPAENITLGPLFRDGMVLQRGVRIPVWGWCEPGRRVRVEILEKKATAVADDAGRWMVVFDPLGHCDSIQINVIGKKTYILRDVMVGEVWFWAGDSNAFFPLAKADDGSKEAKISSVYRLRVFHDGKWQQSGLNSAPYFSAAAYYFGRRMQYEMKEAFGIIQLPGGDRPLTDWLAPNGAVFHEQVLPLLPYPVHGVVWNHHRPAGSAAEYRTQLTDVINAWRRLEGAEHHFVIVQTPNCGSQWPLPQESKLAELREAQLQTSQRVPNAYCLVTIDLGKPDQPLPQYDQRKFADRLAQLTERTAYREHFIKPEQHPAISGPIFDRMIVEGGKIRIQFQSVGKGLEVKNGGRLLHFAIAGQNGRFYWANAAVDGKDVIVWSGKVPKPTAVRYAWSDDPCGCNLFNQDGLPASPFRTDVPTAIVGPTTSAPAATPAPRPTVAPTPAPLPWWDVRRFWR